MRADPMAVDLLLRRKRELDKQNEDALNMASYHRWVADALELLLREVEARASSHA